MSRGLGIVLVLEVVAVGIRYLLQVVLARLAGAEGYGDYTFALTWAQTLAVPAGLGLSSVVIRFVPTYVVREDWSRLRGLLRQAILLTAGAGVSLASLSALSIVFIDTGDADRTALLLGFAYVPLLALSTLQAESLRGGGHVFSARIIPTVFQPLLVIGVSGAVALLTGQLTATGALWCLVMATLLGGTIQQFAIRRSFSARSAGHRPIYATRQWLGVGRQLLTVKLFQLILNNSDILIVGMLLNATHAGFYAVATKTAALTGLATQAINLAVPPAIARAHAQDDPAEVQGLIRWSAKIAFVPSLALALGVIFFADLILSVFGQAFLVAAPGLIILAVGRLATAWAGPVGSVLNVTGYQRINLRVYGLAAAVQLVLDLFLIPHYGIEGAAAASAITMVAWNLALYVYILRVLGIRLWPLPSRESP